MFFPGQQSSSSSFTLPVYSEDSILLGVSAGMEYYTGENLQKIIALLKQPFASVTTTTSHANTGLSPTTLVPARILLYADSLNAYNRMIYRFTYDIPPVLIDDARHQEEQEGEKWFNGNEGQALRNTIPWTHILRWRDVILHSSFGSSLERVMHLYKPRTERPALKTLANAGNAEAQMQLLFSANIDRIVGERVKANNQRIQAWNEIHSDKRIVFNAAEAVKLNQEYLFEECAGEFVIPFLVKDTQHCIPKYVLYPGKVNAAMGNVHQIIQNEFPNMSVMQMNSIRMPHPKPNTKTVSHEPSTISSPHKNGFFSNNLAICPVDIGKLSNDVAKFMRALNGKFTHFQALMLQAISMRANGIELTPTLVRELQEADRYMEEHFRKAEGILDMPLGSSPP